ncbi:MAG: GAF domain-containing protein, partial [Candidatus Sulfotelmatobacter sp.]
MNSIATSIVIIPGVVALLLCLLFWYLYKQSRQAYFLAWQIAWACYSIHYGLDALRYYRPPANAAYFASSLFSAAMAVSIFVSTRLMRGPFRWHWYDGALAFAGTVAAIVDLRNRMVGGAGIAGSPINLEMVFMTAVLLYCSAVFYLHAHRRGSVAFQLLAFSLALWAVLKGALQTSNPVAEMVGSLGHFLGPIPQMLLGVAMVMVLFENERNAVQESTLALSTLGVDPRKLPSAEELVPSMQAALERLMSALPVRRAAICISERWRGLLPSVQSGFSPQFLQAMEASGGGDYIGELTYRQSGIFTVHDVPEMTEPLPMGPIGGFADFKRVVTEAEIRNLTAVSLQAREHNFGVILFPHAERKVFGSSGPRLMVGLALQLGLTLENYVVTHDAHRRTQEYELLTEIGQAISSRLDQDEVLRTIHTELGQIFDTSNFYIAFQEGDDIRFELEVEDSSILSKRSRKIENAFTEYVIRTGQPLLIRSDLEKTRTRLGVTYRPENPAKCLCAAPILLAGRPAGVMVAMNKEREFVFEPRDLDVLVTAAGQVAVAVENARLFAEEQRRSRQLAFLNNISRMAISSDDPMQMLGQIAGEIQKNFSFDHIGIGLLGHGTQEIEIKEEAGTTAHAKGKRISLGTGILG